DFSLPVLGDGTLTDLIADLHSSNVAHTNRRAIARVEHDVSDVGDVFDQTQPTNDVLLVAMLDEVSSGVLIIVLDGFEERFESDVVTDQRLLIDDHVKRDLAGASCDWSHLGFESGRDAVFRGRKALKNLLACEVDVSVVGEV